MSVDAAAARCADRWYPLKPVAEQVRLIGERARFAAVAAGRRAGKSERAKRHLVKAAMREVGPYFAAAPTHDQADRIWWDDLKLLSFADLHPRRPNESKKVITLPNGSTIHVIGLDKPSRIEGVPWRGGVIDEIADTKPKTWTAHIRPALDTLSPDGYLAWCWLIGVPDGLNHFYDICEHAKTSADWGFYHWTSSEVLSPEVIAEAKRALSAREFRQEYEACHLPDTLVAMESGGKKRMCDVRAGDGLLYRTDAGETKPCTVIDAGPTRKKVAMYATLETGEVVASSDDHNFKVPGENTLT